MGSNNPTTDRISELLLELDALDQSLQAHSDEALRTVSGVGASNRAKGDVKTGIMSTSVHSNMSLVSIFSRDTWVTEKKHYTFL